jgi:hypothetical protein
MFSHTLTVSWWLQPDTSRGFCCKVRKARTLWISPGNAGSPRSYLSSTTPSVRLGRDLSGSARWVRPNVFCTVRFCGWRPNGAWRDALLARWDE